MTALPSRRQLRTLDTCTKVCTMESAASEIGAFEASAREFREVVEDLVGTVEPTAIATSLVALLGRLIAEGTALPDVTPSEVDLGESVDANAWGERFSALRAALGDRDLYWSTLDVPAESRASASTVSLADDLADIWKDLRIGLDALDAGADWRDVVFDWRLGFLTHWGRHAVEALRPLHAAIS